MARIYFLFSAALFTCIAASAAYGQSVRTPASVDSATVQIWNESLRGFRFGCGLSDRSEFVVVRVYRSGKLKVLKARTKTRLAVREVRSALKNRLSAHAGGFLESDAIKTKYLALINRIRAGCTEGQSPLLTPTPTSTPTPSTTATSTPTRTPTPTPGNTPPPPGATPSPTMTATPAASSTPSSTPTNLPTATPIPTATPTPGSTSTPTPTGSPGSWPRAAVTVANSLSLRGTTVNFDRPVEIAYYLNGEPAIKKPFIITSVSPVPEYQFVSGQTGTFGPGRPFSFCIDDASFIDANCTEYPKPYWTARCNVDDRSQCQYVHIRNGVERNTIPMEARPDSWRLGAQALDSRGGAGGYQLGTSFPVNLTAPGIDSLLFSRSHPENPSCTMIGSGFPGFPQYDNSCNWNFVNHAWILTAVDEIPFVDEFRPPYVGPPATKKRYYARNMSSTFPSLNPGPNPPSIASVLRSIENTWLVHLGAESYTKLAAGQNMRAYGSAISMEVGHAMLSLARSDVTHNEKLLLAYRLTQIGIDAAHAYWNGGSWTGSGGHGGWGGRISNIALAGGLLNDAPMLGIFSDAGVKNRFAQLCHTYYDSPAEAHNYYGTLNFPRIDPYGHCPTLTPLSGSSRNVDRNAIYTHCCTVTAWRGEVTALGLLGFESVIRHPALFDVIDRFSVEPLDAGGHSSAWANYMWQQYRSQPAYRALLCQNSSLNRCGIGCNWTSNPVLFSGEQGIDCGGSCAAQCN